jgi:hypothetical protein
MDEQLGRDVDAMLSAGVPEAEIGKYIQEYTSSQPKQNGALEQFGVGTRGVLKGVLDTVSMPAALAQNAVAGLAGKPEWQAGSVGDALSDMIGLPQPSTDGEKNAMRFNEGAASVIPSYITGQGMTKAASPLAQALGKMFMDSPRWQALMGGTSTVASGLAGDNGAGMTGQMLAGVAAPMALGGLTALAPAKNINMAKVDAFKRAIGEVPSLGTVSEGFFAPIMESALSKWPLTASGIHKAWDKADVALRNSVDTAATRVSGTANYPKTQNELGQSLLDSVKRAKTDALNNYGQTWDNSISQYVNMDVPIPTTKQIFADKAIRHTPEAAMRGGVPQAALDALEKGNRMLGGVGSDADTLGAASLGAVKDKRTLLMENISNDNVADTMGVTKAEASRVATALRDDMFAALDQRAPAIAAKLRDIDGEYSAWAKKAERVDRRITSGREPEEVAKKLDPSPLTMGDVIRLKGLLSPREWGAVKAGIMNELPRSNQLETSSASFITKTGKGKGAYRPEVQNELFGNNLDDARLIADGMKKAGATVNRSDSGTQLGAMQFIQGAGLGTSVAALLAGNPAAAAALGLTTLGMPLATKAMLTNPTIVRGFTSRPYQEMLRQLSSASGPMIGRGLMSGLNGQEEGDR